MAEGQKSVQWEEVKILAVALKNVREAAIRISSRLPEQEQQRFIERVNKRAYRERWLDKEAEILPPAIANAKPLSKAVQSASSVLANVLSERSNKTKLNLSKAALKASKRFSELDGNTLIDKDIAQSAKHWTGSAAQIHSWQEKEQQQGPLNLQFLGGRAVIQINQANQQG